MPKLNLTRTVPHTAEQMYAIASDVKSYPRFLPLCKQANIIEQNVNDDGVMRCQAELVVGYKKLSIRESFISQVTADPSVLTVEAQSSDGPIRNLDTIWRFSDLPGGGSKISYEIDFTMKSRPLQFLMSSVLDRAVEKVMNGFLNRAAQLYG